MANGNIKGITIELGADTTKLGKALKDVNGESIGLQKELKQVEKLLKFDPGNTELIAQKQQILAQNIDATSKKLETLRNVQDQVNRQFQNGDISVEQYRAFQREIANTESSLNGLQKKLSQSGETKGLDKVKNTLKDIGKAAVDAGKEIGSALGATGAAGAAAVGGLVTGMQETNEQLGMLKVQASEAGVSLEGIDKARGAFASVGQDVNQTTEAMGNLIQAGFKTSDSINDISTSLAGAVVKYGEAFNVEGLAESITTTTQMGEVTGQLMDLLEKEGINVDNFNAKMQGMSSEQERANYISQLLADQGLTSMYNKYVEMNPETTKNAEAQLQLQESLAGLATVMAPLVTKVTEIVTAFVNWANENPVLMSTIAAVGGVLTTIVGIFMALAPIVSVLVNLWPLLTAAFAAISAPVLIVIGVITALIAIGVALYKNWSEVSKYASIAWEAIKNAISTAWEAIKTTTTNVWNSVKSFLSSTWSSVKSTASSAWNGIKSSITSIMDSIKSTVTNIWNSLKSSVSDVVNGIKTTVTNIFNSLKSAVQTAMNNVKTTVTNIWNEVKGFFDGIDLFQTGKDIIQGLINGIGSMKDFVKNIIRDTVGNVVDFAKSLLGIASPSKVMRDEVGKWIPEGIAAGIEGNLNVVSKASQGMAELTVPKIDMQRFNTSGIAQGFSGKQNITIMLDSRVIGRAVAPVVGREITVKAGFR